MAGTEVSYPEIDGFDRAYYSQLPAPEGIMVASISASNKIDNITSITAVILDVENMDPLRRGGMELEEYIENYFVFDHIHYSVTANGPGIPDEAELTRIIAGLK
jgi:hypothetical protein